MIEMNFLIQRVLKHINKNIYIKQSPYSFKKLVIYFLLLTVFFIFSLFIDKYISVLIFLSIIFSSSYFYSLIRKKGVFIELTEFNLDGKTHKVVEHIRIDDLYESSIITFLELGSGVYWVHSKLTLFLDKKCLHFAEIQEILKKRKENNLSVLMLGGGTESVSCMIANLDHVKSVDSVELSKTMQRVGKQHFISTLSKKNQDKINQIFMDAEKFLNENKVKYDFIFVDLFSDSFLPEFVFNEIFLFNLNNSLKSNGEVFFNFAGYEDIVKKNMNRLNGVFKNFALYRHKCESFAHFIGLSNKKNQFKYYKKVK